MQCGAPRSLLSSTPIVEDRLLGCIAGGEDDVKDAMAETTHKYSYRVHLTGEVDAMTIDEERRERICVSIGVIGARCGSCYCSE
jgi:hypothetical protein